jgi:YD repeat-containing protein
MPYQATEGSPHYLETIYDAIGREVEVKWPRRVEGGFSVSSVRTKYEGWIKTTEDDEGTSVRSEHDAYGNVISMREPNPEGGQLETTYRYDIFGRMLSFTTPTAPVTGPGDDLVAPTIALSGMTTEFHYDSLGRLRQSVSPVTGMTDFKYNLNGNVISRTDARGCRVRIVYDNLDRKTLEYTVSVTRDASGTETGESTTDPVDWTHIRRTFTYDVPVRGSARDATGTRYGQRDARPLGRLVQCVNETDGITRE